MERLALVDRKHFSATYRDPAMRQGFVERTIPDKPTSPHQKYRRTAKGHALLQNVSLEDVE